MKIKIVKAPQAKAGLEVEGNQYTPISKNMIMLGGDTHAKGGTMLSYQGKTIEAEKGEPVSIGENNEAVIWGNMRTPGTTKKFKSIAKELGEQEAKYDRMATTGTQKVLQNKPDEKWERLAFNTGKIMQMGGKMGMEAVGEKRNQLASLQKAMLQHAEMNNLDPQAMSMGRIKKARKGAFVGYEDGGDTGDPTVSDRHNNPGNIKWTPFFAKRYGAVKGEKSKDGDYFAKFPDRQTGFVAMDNLLRGKSYGNRTVKDAINRWTGGKPYEHDLGPLEGKKISDLSPSEYVQVRDAMIAGEGTKYGTRPAGSPVNVGGKPNTDIYVNKPYNFTEQGLPQVQLTPEASPPDAVTATPPQVPDFTLANKRNIPTNAQSLAFNQILPEAYAFATNRQQPVALQKYTPQLYVPYQMSFQDRINQNQDTFNAISRQVTGRPEALGILGAQKYSADNAVRAEEFRTNQGIQADTINKNVALNNDAQLKNLQLADVQYTRQAEAKAKTQELNQMILSSISGKVAQNTLNNKRLQAYENLYDFRFTRNPVSKGTDAVYMGPNAYFGLGNSNRGMQGDGTTTVYRDAYGNPIRTSVRYPSQEQQLNEELRNRELQYKNYYNIAPAPYQ